MLYHQNIVSTATLAIVQVNISHQTYIITNLYNKRSVSSPSGTSHLYKSQVSKLSHMAQIMKPHLCLYLIIITTKYISQAVGKPQQPTMRKLIITNQLKTKFKIQSARNREQDSSFWHSRRRTCKRLVLEWRRTCKKLICS